MTPQEVAEVMGLVETFQDMATQMLIEEVWQKVPKNLEEPCLWLIRAGGKRIRAMIPAAICGACGGDPEDAMLAGVAVEMLHTFTLIHDDIMDESSERRGVEAVHERWSTSTAILAGNVLFARALDVLGKGYGEWAVSDALEASMSLGLGQQMDLELGDVALPFDLYQKIIEAKTAPLFTLAANLGAQIAGASLDVVKAMEKWGYNFGMSFQARDDVLDRYEVASGIDLQGAALEYSIQALGALEAVPFNQWRHSLSIMTQDQVNRGY